MKYWNLSYINTFSIDTETTPQWDVDDEGVVLAAADIFLAAGTSFLVLMHLLIDLELRGIGRREWPSCPSGSWASMATSCRPAMDRWVPDSRTGRGRCRGRRWRSNSQTRRGRWTVGVLDCWSLGSNGVLESQAHVAPAHRSDGACSLLCSTPPRTVAALGFPFWGDRGRDRDREGEGGRLAVDCLQACSRHREADRDREGLRRWALQFVAMWVVSCLLCGSCGCEPMSGLPCGLLHMGLGWAIAVMYNSFGSRVTHEPARVWLVKNRVKLLAQLVTHFQQSESSRVTNESSRASYRVTNFLSNPSSNDFFCSFIVQKAHNWHPRTSGGYSWFVFSCHVESPNHRLWHTLGFILQRRRHPRAWRASI
jgi:hypothetical protein